MSLAICFLLSFGSPAASQVSTRIITTGADASVAPLVRRFDADSHQPTSGPTGQFEAFASSFTGGVRVADGDFTGDGIADIVAGTGPGVAARILIFDGATGAVLREVDPGFAGTAGVFVAAGDVDGDGYADLIAGDGGASTVVRVFGGTSGAVLWSLTIGDAAFAGGVRVAAGDINFDGFADLVVGNGPGAETEVRRFDAATRAPIGVPAGFSPYPGFAGGVWVAAGDVTGDGGADVITGSGEGGDNHVRVFRFGDPNQEVLSTHAAAPIFLGGVRVAAGDVDGDLKADVITALGPGANLVQVYSGLSGAPIASITVGRNPGAGLFVSTAVPINRAVIDSPVAGGVIWSNFRISGWAFEDGSLPDAGIDAIDFHAFPTTGAREIYVGRANLREPRPDVAAIFGARFLNSGFHLDGHLAPGEYDLKMYVHPTEHRNFNIFRTVRVRVRDSAEAVLVEIDTPPSGTVRPNVTIAGWAFDQAGTAAGSGIDAVHVWAYANNGQQLPMFLGAATLGDSRPDVGAVFGGRAAQSGYHLTATLPAGDFTLSVYVKSFLQPTFTALKTVRVSVVPWAPSVRMSIDSPVPGVQANGTFLVGGWALALDAPSTPGIQALHVWAYPVNGSAPTFLGAAVLGFSRPDVGAIFGSDYEASGFNLMVENLPSGTWDLALYPLADGASAFDVPRVVRVIAP